MNLRYKVDYDTWDTTDSPYSICRLHSQDKQVVFNMAHPLFESELSDDIIKKLALGFSLIAEKKGSKEILKQLNELLEEVFLGA